jgi:hemoglobin
MTESSQTVYEIIGPEGFERLTAAFCRRVAADPVLRPIYPEDDLAVAARHLRLFLVQFFGGPRTYSDERGHSRLRLRHAPFRIDQAARDVWMRHMLAAMDEARLPAETQIPLREYFVRTATEMINTVMPD